MNTIDTNEIIWQAKRMRAEETRRLAVLIVSRVGQHVRFLAGSAAEALRALFSGSHQAHHS